MVRAAVQAWVQACRGRQGEAAVQAVTLIARIASIGGRASEASEAELGTVQQEQLQRDASRKRLARRGTPMLRPENKAPKERKDPHCPASTQHEPQRGRASIDHRAYTCIGRRNYPAQAGNR